MKLITAIVRPEKLDELIGTLIDNRAHGLTMSEVRGFGRQLGQLPGGLTDLVRPEDRKHKIEAELRQLASAKGLRIHADAHLMELVTYLNEYPTAILGGFDPSYLELPDEILITVMRDHQKYFALEKRDGSLAPHFLAIINLDKDRAGLIRAGHERVLRARFADARFFLPEEFSGGSGGAMLVPAWRNFFTLRAAWRMRCSFSTSATRT